MCWRENVTYKIECLECKKKGKQVTYFGETGRSAYTRSGNHVDDFRMEADDNAIVQHKIKVHNDENIGPEAFKMKVLGTHNSNLKRQISEGLLIEAALKTKNIDLLNNKNQFIQPRIVKVRPTSAMEYQDD